MTGSAEIAGANDEALASFYVEVQDADLGRAQSQVNQRMAEATAALKRADPRAEVQTSGYQSYPVYRDNTRKPVGWRVRQGVTRRAPAPAGGRCREDREAGGSMTAGDHVGAPGRTDGAGPDPAREGCRAVAGGGDRRGPAASGCAGGGQVPARRAHRPSGASRIAAAHGGPRAARRCRSSGRSTSHVAGRQARRSPSARARAQVSANTMGPPHAMPVRRAGAARTRPISV
ncbi:MAG: SIMPL domain-containing protein [bacterium]